MAGQLIRMKLRIMWNTVRSQTAVLIFSIIGILYGLGFTGFAYFGIAKIATMTIQAPWVFVMLPGPVIFVGWIICPVIMASMDNSLEPRRLSPFVAPTHELARALIAASCVGIGAIFSGLFIILPAWFYLFRGQWAMAAGSLIAGLLTLLTAIVWAKAITTWAGNQIQKDSTRKNLAGFIGTMVFISVFAPMGIWFQLIAEHFSYDTVLAALPVVYTTPFGSFFGVVASLSESDYLTAGIRFVIAAVTAGAAWFLWLRVLGPAMHGVSRPVSAQAQQAIKEGRYHVDEERASKEREQQRQDSRALGLKYVQRWEALGFSPQSASMATKTVYYWLHDSRLSTSLASSIFFPFMAVLMSFLMDSESRSEVPFSFNFFLYLAPLLIGTTIGATMQYDSTAAWIPIASGVRGAQDRLGRLLGSLVLITPVILIADSIASTILGNTLADTAWVLGLCILLLAASSSTAMIIGSRWVYQVQQPGTSPLSTRGTGSGMVAMWAISAATLGGLLGALPGWLALYFAAGHTIAFIGAFVFSLVWSACLLTIAVKWGGKLWDRYKVEMLNKMQSWPGR